MLNNNLLIKLWFSLLLGLTTSCVTSIKSEYQSKHQNSYSDLVYPLLDTENSRWFFFSSASRPFGMVNLSPDTEINGAWGTGYRYKTDTIKGFSHIHAWQLSGISVMPVTISKENENSVYSDFYSKFSHDSEEIHPGYHRLELNRYRIKASLTSTLRVGFHHYSFSSGSVGAVLFNLNTALGPNNNEEGELIKFSDRELHGKVVLTPTQRRPKPVTVYFSAVFDSDISEIRKDDETGNFLVFPKLSGQDLYMKIGISYTSVANARLNIEKELNHWDFNRVVSESKNEWNDLLGRIKVEGGSETNQRRFYTDLWHALQGRRIINDVNGAYPDNTGDDFRVGQLPLNSDGIPKFNHFNSDSFWGAQWTINTLWGLVYPEIKQQFVYSLLQYYKDGGLIPRGPSGGNYTYVMTGAATTPFIVSAIQEGLITEDLEYIYEALKKNHMPGGIMEKAGYEHKTNSGGGLKHYLANGFVPYPIPEGQFAGHQDGASLTLEYAYQDWTLAQLAKKLGKEEEYTYFLHRSENFKNIFDLESGWMRPRDIKGKWLENFDPYNYRNGFVEANGAQATWFVPHNLEGLSELMGGSAKAVDKLQSQFEQAEKLGFTAGTSHDVEEHPEFRRIPINYGNQPSIQTAFVFHKLGRADLSHYWSRKVVGKTFSGLSPSTGYNGDEDQGLMGSLSVLMKIGIFQMNGGVDEDPEYLIGSPIFNRITIKLNPNFYSNSSININAKNNRIENVYVLSPQWNTKQLGGYSIRHSQIMKGGTLELEMSNRSENN